MKRLLDWIIEWLHYQQTEIMRAYMLQGEVSKDEYVWKNLDYYRRYVDPWRGNGKLDSRRYSKAAV